KYNPWTDDDVRHLLATPTEDRLFAIYQALRRGFTVEEISKLTMIHPYFIWRIENVIFMEKEIAESFSVPVLKKAKRMGFTDDRIAKILGKKRAEITDLRLENGIVPSYKMVDTCAAEFSARTP